MSDPDEPVGVADAADEVLVAYLDGQLPPEECEAIESRLASDPAMRERLQSLDRVWNALDALPRSTASAAFTRSTIDMATVTAAKPASAGRRWRPSRSLLAVVSGLALGAVLAGVLLGAPERRALRDLPTALHAAALENAGSVEFLERLAADAGDRLAAFQTEPVEREARRWGELAAESAPQRRAWLEGLGSDELADVSSRVDRFQDRSEAARSSLERVADEIAEHERSDELRRVALAYHALVGRLPPGEQARLRGLSVDERLAEARRLAPRLARDATYELTDAERDELRAAVQQVVESDDFVAAVEALSRRIPRDRGGRPFEPPPERVLLALARFVGSDLPNRWPRADNLGDRVRNDRMRRAMQERLERFEEDRERLTRRYEEAAAAWARWESRLEPAAPERVRLALADASGVAERARRWEGLLREATRESLADAFADLPNDELSRALLLSTDELTEKLSGGDDDRFGFGANGPLGLGGPGPPRGGAPPDRRGFGPPPGGRDFFSGEGPAPRRPPNGD